MIHKIHPVSGGSGEDEDDQGHEIDPDEMIRGALEEKLGSGQGAGEENKTEDKPAPEKPVPAAPTKGEDVAWFLAKRDVKKSCKALDDADIEVLVAASGGDPIKFVELAERQQAKIETLMALKPKGENEDEELRKRAAAEILDGGGPGGSGGDKPKEPTPAEKQSAAVKSGDTQGILKATAEVFNAGKDGKPIFAGPSGPVRVQS